jgi:hypothetical protein
MRTPAPWSWTRLHHGFAPALRGGALLACCWMLAAPLAAFAQEQLDEEPTSTLSDKPASKPKSASEKKEADRKARELFEQGRALFKDGRYRDAWEHFRDAYLLSKRPELLYNVGQSADRMRMDREALAAFKLYLEKLPNAENRREVQARIAFLEKQVNRDGNGEVSPTTLDDSTDAAPTVESSGTSGDATTQSPESLPDDDTASSGADTNPDLDEQSADNKPEVEEPTNTNGQPERTKWYARAALGLGFLADSLSEASAKSLSSVTISGEFGIGYDIHDGVVIGGGLTLDWGLAPSAKIGDVSNDIDTANLTLVMAFVDYYLSPRDHGWHLLGGLGYGGLALSDQSTTVGVENGSGGGLVLGGGCEWPLDKDWAIGGMLKVVLARMSTDTAQHTIFAPSAVATATWY